MSDETLMIYFVCINDEYVNLLALRNSNFFNFKDVNDQSTNFSYYHIYDVTFF